MMASRSWHVTLGLLMHFSGCRGVTVKTDCVRLAAEHFQVQIPYKSSGSPDQMAIATRTVTPTYWTMGERVACGDDCPEDERCSVHLATLGERINLSFDIKKQPENVARISRAEHTICENSYNFHKDSSRYVCSRRAESVTLNYALAKANVLYACKYVTLQLSLGVNITLRNLRLMYFESSYTDDEKERLWTSAATLLCDDRGSAVPLTAHMMTEGYSPKLLMGSITTLFVAVAAIFGLSVLIWYRRSRSQLRTALKAERCVGDAEDSELL